MITPFAGVRGDVAALELENQSGPANFINPAEHEVARAMPDVGVEIATRLSTWSCGARRPSNRSRRSSCARTRHRSETFPTRTPRAWCSATPTCSRLTNFPAGPRRGRRPRQRRFPVTAQVNQAGSLNVLFGQSYQIFGANSYSATDLTNTGLQSGLDKSVSDYVGRITYQPNQVYSFTARGRFDEETFTPQRLEFESRANFDRWTLQLMYGDYAAQPDIGFLTRREEILAVPRSR